MVTEETIRQIEIITVTVIVGGLGVLALSNSAPIERGPGAAFSPDMMTLLIAAVTLIGIGILIFRFMSDTNDGGVVVVNQGEASNCFGEQMQRCGNGLHQMLGYDSYHECLDKESQQQCQRP